MLLISFQMYIIIVIKYSQMIVIVIKFPITQIQLITNVLIYCPNHPPSSHKYRSPAPKCRVTLTARQLRIAPATMYRMYLLYNHSSIWHILIFFMFYEDTVMITCPQVRSPLSCTEIKLIDDLMYIYIFSCIKK